MGFRWGCPPLAVERPGTRPAKAGLFLSVEIPRQRRSLHRLLRLSIGRARRIAGLVGDPQLGRRRRGRTAFRVARLQQLPIPLNPVRRLDRRRFDRVDHRRYRVGGRPVPAVVNQDRPRRCGAKDPFRSARRRRPPYLSLFRRQPFRRCRPLAEFSAFNQHKPRIVLALPWHGQISTAFVASGGNGSSGSGSGSSPGNGCDGIGAGSSCSGTVGNGCTFGAPSTGGTIGGVKSCGGAGGVGAGSGAGAGSVTGAGSVVCGGCALSQPIANGITPPNSTSDAIDFIGFFSLFTYGKSRKLVKEP